MPITKPKKNEFVVHCIMCGKDFRVGDKAECGGLVSGKPMCRTGDIQRELDSRLSQQRERILDGIDECPGLTMDQDRWLSDMVRQGSDAERCR